MFTCYKTTINKGFLQKEHLFSEKESSYILTLNKQKKYQKVLGFGGAFTEAAAYTFSKMSASKQKEILTLYFDQNKGLRYNLGRVAIHSCDFALENYTYIKDYDESLETFSIEREYKWVIPMIKQAQEYKLEPLKLLASPWSPPAWMKSNNSMNHGGELLPKYYDVWAKYYLKFLESYKHAGINIFALSVQNEPAAKQVWDSCIYSAEQERDFVKNHLGPTLAKSKFSDTKILIWDHNRDILFERADTVLKDAKANQYIWGVGFHWYVSEAFENLSKLHHHYPTKHLLFTEGCIEGGVCLGDFKSGERYARNMIGDFSNYCEGYIDWNLMLDSQGGPNHVGNYCDAPIICDVDQDTYHINSSYYAIAHFSKFVDVNASRIDAEITHPFVTSVAFMNPNGDIIVILQNETNKDTSLTLNIDTISKNIDIEKRSIITITIRGEITDE